MSSNLVDDPPVKHFHLKERSSIPSSFRSNVIDLDAQPGCWVANAFDYVLFRVPRKELDGAPSIRSWASVRVDGGETTRDPHKCPCASPDKTGVQEAWVPHRPETWRGSSCGLD